MIILFVSSHFKYEFIPKKTEPHLSIFIVYDLEKHKGNRARAYCISFYRIRKICARYGRDQTCEELDERKKHTIVFDGDNCVGNALAFLLKLKGEERKVKNILVEYNLQLHPHNGSGFDARIILNNLSCDKHFVDINKNRKGIISLKIFNIYIKKMKSKFLNI